MEYTYQTPQEEQDTTGFTIKNARKLLIFGSVGLFFLVGALLSLLSLNKTPSAQVATIVAVPTKIPPQQKGVPKAPAVYFASYQNTATLPTQSPNYYYTVKSNFSPDEVKQFATKLGLTSYSGKGKITNAYNFSDAQSIGILAFNTTSGAFKYQAYGDKRPTAYKTGQSAVATAQQMLTDIGLFDDTLICPVTYQQKGAPEGTTFVECHRDWQKIGLPIVNLVGMVNLPETKKLAEFTVGKTDELTPQDPTITSVNTGDNGKKRPADFNTITVGVRKDGSIFSIVSSMRMLSEKKAIGAQEVIGSSEIVQQLQQHKSQFSLTIPAGSGSVDFAKVYPGNTATAKIATVDEVSLVYPDTFMDKSLASYEPTYLIRGTAKLSSGYTVRFVQTIPARKQQLAKLAPQNMQQVAGVSTQVAQNQINIGSFTPQESATPTTPPVTVTQPTSTVVPTIPPTVPPTPTVTQPTPTPDPVTVCGGTQDQTIVIDGGNIVLTSAGFGYHIINLVSTRDNIDMETVRQKFYDAIADEYAVRVAKWVQQNPSLADEVPLMQYIKTGSACTANNTLIANLDMPTLPVCSVTLESSATAYEYNYAAANAITANAANQIQQVGVAALATRGTIFPSNYGHFSEMLLQYSGTSNHGGNAIGPCYVSGFSPVIFFYPDKATQFSVSTNAPVTYADPTIADNSWSGTVNANGSVIINNQERESLYYEYDKKVSLSGENSGFVIERSKLASFIRQTVGKSLNLNEKEIAVLITEARIALVGTSDSTFLKLSIVHQEEINQKLPLTILPQPQHVYRIHLLLTPLHQEEFIVSQRLSPIIRSGFTVVELGARTQ